MCKEISQEKWLSVVLGLLENNPKAEMLLLAAYIDNELCYEFFCEEIPLEVFNILRLGIEENLCFRRAIIECGILQRSVPYFISASFDGWNMWYHFLEGTETILTSPELIELLSVHDRNLACSLLALWRKRLLNEDNWDSYLCNTGILH